MSSDNPFRDLSNPYESGAAGESASEESMFDANGEIVLPPGMRRGLVGHVPIVGWLMIVQGVFELLLGIGFIVLAFLLPAQVVDQVQKNPALQNQGVDFTPEQLTYLIMALYGGMGAVAAVIGLLSIFGGYRITRYRSYIFSIVTISCGFFTIFGGCYCFPSALVLGIYGLIVLLNEPVKRAFSFGKLGCSRKQIKAAFADLPK